MRLLHLAFLAPLAAPLLIVAAATPAFAQAASPPPGTPPPDQKALVAAPKPVADAPKADAGKDSTNATVSAGGQLATGNSRLLAMTANAKFDMRRGANAFGAAIIGNYGEGAASPSAAARDDHGELPGAPALRPVRARPD